jgi:peptide deformylase
MAVREILLLGNPALYRRAQEVDLAELPQARIWVSDLHDTLLDFRQRYRAGRAIAAPQIGVSKRLIYMNVGEPVVFVNPVLEFPDDEMMTVWDDCMSFPELMVKVERHRRCRVRYRDTEWNEQVREYGGDFSELIQHEYDHLDGVLAVMRALDGYSFALRSQRAYH